MKTKLEVINSILLKHEFQLDLNGSKSRFSLPVSNLIYLFKNIPLAFQNGENKFQIFILQCKAILTV